MRNLLLLLLGVLLCNAVGFGQESSELAANGAAERAKFLERFPASDTNGDGMLSARELMAFLQKQRSSPNVQSRLKDFVKLFPEADLNSDGELSLDEWKTFVAKEQAATTRSNAPQGLVPDVAYGEHKLQRFDIWPVPGAKAPTPLVIFIHGGGFRGGDKAGVPRGTVEKFHAAGVAFASMNYRLSDSGPYPIMMHDAARGLQTIRHRAREWNVQPDRIACFGGSAGAGISLWLAFHDDLADPDSDDPIARQSTRILAAGTMNGQSTYDMHTIREWVGIPDLAIHPALPAFMGVQGDADINTPAIRALMKDASPITHLDADDQAAVYMVFNRPNTKITAETDASTWVHHVIMGLKLREAMEKLGRECIVTSPDMPAESTRYNSLEDFLIAQVKGDVNN